MHKSLSFAREELTSHDRPQRREAFSTITGVDGSDAEHGTAEPGASNKVVAPEAVKAVPEA